VRVMGGKLNWFEDILKSVTNCKNHLSCKVILLFDSSGGSYCLNC
jgi:hypothetical protein